MEGHPPPFYPPPPPLPADDRIKGGVRRGEAFSDPYDAQRAIVYGEQFLRTGQSVAQPPVLLGIAAGLALTVLLQITVGVVYVLVVPVGLFIGVVGYLIWFRAKRPLVEQSLAANRRTAGL